MTISAQLTSPASPAPSRPTPSTHDPLGRGDLHARRGRRTGARPAGDRDNRAEPRNRHEPPTGDPGRTGRPTRVDAFARLDHRTRSRSVALADAPPGRYLSAGDGEEIRLVALDQPIIRIGRGLGADVRIDDPHVSRRHAIIVTGGNRGRGGARVLDDRSANGTQVNGHPVTVGQLSDGDVLRLGRVVMRFVEIAPAVRLAPLRRFPLAAVARRQVIPDAG